MKITGSTIEDYAESYSMMSFDFHDLDTNELYDLTELIRHTVENLILNPPSQEWVDFVEYTKKAHRIKGGTHGNEEKQ